MLTPETYLVRHGSYDPITKHLDAQGISDSEKALQKLLAYGLGETALVLSSDAQRAIQTSEIIARGLGAKVISSLRMRIGPNDVRAIDNLDEWINASLEEAGIVRNGEHLVVVAHEPMLRVASYGTTHGQGLPFGHVMPYELGSWENHDYRHYVAEYVEQQIAQGY